MQSISIGAVYKALTIIKLKELVVLVPPIAEQKCIVKKVDELKLLTNQLRDVIGVNKKQGRGRPNK
jgi:restriction endonuclease S subunit